MSSFVSQKVNHYISYWPKNNLYMLHLILFSFNLKKSVSSVFMRYIQSLVMRIKILSKMYTHIYSDPWNILFFFSGKPSGKIQTHDREMFIPITTPWQYYGAYISHILDCTYMTTSNIYFKWYIIFNSSNFSSILFFDMTYRLHFRCLFKSLK